ncbi:PD40 domain-containing protein [Actinoplanes sp. LDG1-06]|uniref:PD40 domain-containing protein n=1 Tax=Paractinoplanes ovalisporus TaxID=2810368 RepID=A0ABS2AE94_9ACTN|nr:PD40 domain-containing protein [Actinoplanes ovalisporus]MBM2618162.1 PD40 domain-containing protein [Actinoplanes ovalisporus]
MSAEQERPRDHDRLRSSLHDLADIAEPADMYERAVTRSRRIARKEAAVGTGAAMVVLVVLASGLWQMPHGKQQNVPVAAAPQSASSVLPSLSSTAQSSGSASSATPGDKDDSPARPPRPDKPANKPKPAKPKSRTLSDMPGHVFYAEHGTGPDVVRMSPSDGNTEVVLSDAPSSVGISPDGYRIAYVSDGKLLVSEAGGETKQVAANIDAVGQAPVWSPEGSRLLVAESAPGVLDLESGEITPLPEGLASGQHFRWSGDGSTLVYATSYCGLKVAGAEAGTSTTVPVLGDKQPQDNPDGLAACKPTSVDATGARVTVPLQTTGEQTTGTDTADAVIDTATGDLAVLPVSGSVVGAVFDTDGNLLVRTEDDGKTLLSLFGPDNTLKVQAKEPASVRGLDLLAYTR